MDLKDLYFITFELSLVLNRTGDANLNNKTISKIYKIPTTEINKVFLNQYIFGANKKRDLNYLDYLIQEFKHKVAEIFENIHLSENIDHLTFVKRSIRFENWLADVKIQVKEI